MKKYRFGWTTYLIFAAATVAVMLLCICVGSVNIPVKETVRSIWCLIRSQKAPQAIIVSVRIPRVLCVALVGASLSLAGTAMQGLLRNPLADGSTLGVSSGAALGAVIAMAFGLKFPWIGSIGTMMSAIVFAFVSLVLILGLAYGVDRSLSTNTIILIGVIFSMFTSSLISLVIAFAGERVKTITFWTMGSLADSNYSDALILFGTLVVFGGVILALGRELNAFAIGETNAMHIGVNVKRVKLFVLVCASALIGVCVSVGGTIGFVGLVIPHMTRFITGPNHRKLLPTSIMSGAFFLMLTDLAARTVINPRQLPIGVVTSLVGAVAFVFIFRGTRRKT